jgi:hypothetical protein
MGVMRIPMDDQRVVHGRLHPESGVVEAAVAVAVAEVVEQAETAPVMVVEEVKLSNDARRQCTGGA